MFAMDQVPPSVTNTRLESLCFETREGRAGEPFSELPEPWEREEPSHFLRERGVCAGKAEVPFHLRTKQGQGSSFPSRTSH